MYNSEHLKMFVTIVSAGSFSACARKLGKVQSAVSQGVASLEVDMNCQLFDRRTKLPSLTEEGEQLLPYARAVLAQLAELESAVSAIEQQTEMKLTLAIDPVLIVMSIKRVLQQFSIKYPETVLELKVMPSSEIALEVERGQADIGLMFCDVAFPREVSLCYLGNVEFVAIAGLDHFLAKQESVAIGDMIAHRQILFSEAGNSQQQIPSISAAVWQSDSYSGLIGLVEQGIGWGYVPRHMVEKACVHILAIDFDHKPWTVSVDRVLQKGRKQGAAMAWLSQEIAERFE